MEINNVEMAVLPKGKIVTEASMARKLIKDGYRVIDIKPKRGKARESVFVFEDVPGLSEKVDEYFQDRKNKFVNKED